MDFNIDRPYNTPGQSRPLLATIVLLFFLISSSSSSDASQQAIESSDRNTTNDRNEIAEYKKEQGYGKNLLHISKKAKDDFHLYNEETCRNHSVDDIREFYAWEKNTFLYSLRTALLPSTSKGDFSKLTREELDNMLPEMINLSSKKQSQCKAQESPDDEVYAKASQDELENNLVNVIFFRMTHLKRGDYIDPATWKPVARGRKEDPNQVPSPAPPPPELPSLNSH